jgi:drug/metabolite transporter (DMT)-like permease
LTVDDGECRLRAGAGYSGAGALAGRDGGSGSLVFLTLMVLITSTTAPAAKFAVRELPVGLLPLIRFGVAGLCLLPIACRGGALIRMVREDRARLFVSAALCVPINQTFFLYGLRLVPTSHVALIYATCPVVVLTLALLLRQERMVLGRLVGVLASVLGVAVIALDNLFQGGAGRHAVLRGDLLIVGAVVSWGAYLTVSKPLIGRHGALPALAGTFLIGGLLDLPIALATSGDWPPLASVSTGAWRGLAYLTLVVTVFGLACQNQAMHRLEASQVATAGNASPILTVIWGTWLFAETITTALIVGAALTLGGILWTSRRPRPALALIGSAKEIKTVASGG